MSFAQELSDSPTALTKKMLGDNWSTILPEIDRNTIGWDRWFCGLDISIRFKENFFNVFQGQRREDVGINIITDPYNVDKHYISTVDIHYFVRDYNLTNQSDIIPINMNLLVLRIEDFFEKNPRYLWESEGISNLYPSGQDLNLPFDEPSVYHSIQHITLEYTKIDKPLPDYTRS
jgi:hypothetical protein